MQPRKGSASTFLLNFRQHNQCHSRRDFRFLPDPFRFFAYLSAGSQRWAVAAERATIAGMTSVNRIATVRIELDRIDPPVWRRVEVPLTTTLRGLHDVIQAALLFLDYHLFQFDVGTKCYGIPDPEWNEGPETFDANNITLAKLVERGFLQFSYTYDFGDNWRHSIDVETTSAADPSLSYPRFINGARRAPPEDVGGVPGFCEFLEAMASPRHPEHKRLRAWYGGPFDPGDIDVSTIMIRMEHLARRRRSLKVHAPQITPNDASHRQ